MLNRESTLGYSNVQSSESHDKLWQRIGLDKQNICRCQMERNHVSGGVSVPSVHAISYANYCSMETSRKGPVPLRRAKQ